MKILLYNERNYAYNHTKLLSTPVEQEVAPVGISVPTGTFQLNYGGYFTHIKFNFDGVDWICRITARRSLGDTLHEYDYAIDYLKDYYNKYGFVDQDIVIERSTDPALWKKFIVDNQFPRGDRVTLTSHNGYIIPMCIMLVVGYFGTDGIGVEGNSNACDVYFINFSQWYNVQLALANPKAKKPGGSDDSSIDLSPNYVDNFIQGIYIVPDPRKLGSTSSTPFQTFTSTSHIDLLATIEGYDPPIQNAQLILRRKSGSGGYLYTNIDKLNPVSSISGITARCPIVTDSIDAVADWRDIELKKYIAYAPLYGSFEINPQNFDELRYHISPASGSISISTKNGALSTMLPPQKLPQVSRFRDETVTQTKLTNYNATISTGASTLSSLVGVGASAVTGGATGALALGGISGMAGSVGNILQQKYAIEQKGISYSPLSGVFGSEIQYTELDKYTVEQPLSLGEFASRNGLYCNFKITDSIPETTVSKRCWLNLNGARIKGERWYSANVINELNGECVMIDV